MRLQRVNLSLSSILCLFCVYSFAPHFSRAEERAVTSGHQLATLVKPAHWKEEDHIYREFMASTDNRITQEYKDRWNWHEQQVAYAATSWNYEHYAMASLQTSASYEGDVRKEFADRVLRMRLDSTVKNFLRPEDGRAINVRKAHQKLERLRDYPVRFSDEQPGEFRFGYDFITGSTKLEYFYQDVVAGVYHPKLLGGMNGQDIPLNAATFKVSKQWGLGLPLTSLSHVLNSSEIQAAFSHAFNRSVLTQFTSTYSVRESRPLNYSLQVIYNF